MAEQVLYRKYRPSRFSEVLGQDHVVDILRKTVIQDRIAHAYLFSGSRGTGKTSVARILAKAMNCPNVVDGEPCNECQVCQGVDGGGGSDYYEMDAATNRGIDDIRALRDALVYTPVRSRFRVYVIDEVHMLTKEAANCFLKSLEEPQSFIKFIFCTTERERMIATIQSRCTKFDFRLVSDVVIVDCLQRICEAEKVQYEDTALCMLAQAAQGSIRDAQSLLQNFVSSGLDVDQEMVAYVVGCVPVESLFEIMDKVLTEDQLGAVTELGKVFAQTDPVSFCLQFLGHLSRLLLAKVDRSLIQSTDQDKELYVRQAVQISDVGLLSMIEVVKTQLYRAKQAPEVISRAGVEMMILGMSVKGSGVVRISEVGCSFAKAIGALVESVGEGFVEIASKGGKRLFVVDAAGTDRPQKGDYMITASAASELLGKGSISPKGLVEAGVIREVQAS